MREQTSIEKSLEDTVYNDRLLVLLEGAEGFHQVRLTQEQFKAVSDAICVLKGEPDENQNQQVWLDIGPESVPLKFFEGMSTTCEKHEYEHGA